MAAFSRKTFGAHCPTPAWCWTRWLGCRLPWWAVAMGGIGMMIALSTFSALAGSPVQETELKAAWMLNFAKLSQWPEATFDTTNAPIVIGVMGDHGFADQLEKSLREKLAHGRAFTIRRVDSPRETVSCHMLYFGGLDADAKQEVLRLLEGVPVLTIDGSEGGAESGSIVKFLRIQNKIRFDIDLEVANQSHMRIHPRLLQVAHSVRGKRQESKRDGP